VDHSWGYGSEQRLREENQDCYGVFEFSDYTLAIVCDGMGGHVGGAQASTLAVRTIHDTLRELKGRSIPDALEEALQRTNIVIYEAARKNHRLMGMGTTAVVAAITGDKCYMAHVGDSRAYLLRQGNVQQLTRDHTMVNLFVDAELLSPEDAATHPEAHVLSRSLGVERQVDVELAEPISVVGGDAVFLCSDGVHGVVTDWELANVDWGAPHEGVRSVLGIVGTREGDDNATAVTVMMGTSFEDVASTPPPEPKRFDEASPASGVTAVPFDEQLAYDPAVGPGGGHPGIDYDDDALAVHDDPAGLVIAPEPARPLHMPKPSAQPPAVREAEPPSHKAPETPPRSTPSKKTPRKPKRRSAILPLLVAATAMLIALVMVLILLIPKGGQTDPAGNEQVIVEDWERLDGNAEVEPEVQVQPAEMAAQLQEEEPEPIEQQLLFAPDLPPAPRRLPTRPVEFTQPPPGGPLQFMAVEATRRQDCPQALAAVQEGMKTISVDHATLYSGAWLCFNEAHQRELEQGTVATWDDFKYKLPHFEGTPEQQQAAVRDDKTGRLGRLPHWYRPAVGGVEYRMEMLAQDEEMGHVLTDLLGEPTVADQLAKDVMMEALAARGLSRVPLEGRTPSLVAAWARRVYVTAWALRSSPGRLLDQYRRSDVLPEVRRLLKDSTEPWVAADGTAVPVPEVVQTARDVGAGNLAPPSGRPKPRPARNNGFREPDMGDDPEGSIKVHSAAGG